MRSPSVRWGASNQRAAKRQAARTTLRLLKTLARRECMCAEGEGGRCCICACIYFSFYPCSCVWLPPPCSARFSLSKSRNFVYRTFKLAVHTENVSARWSSSSHGTLFFPGCCPLGRVPCRIDPPCGRCTSENTPLNKKRQFHKRGVLVRVAVHAEHVHEIHVSGFVIFSGLFSASLRS